jgi:hypothetical protein
MLLVAAARADAPLDIRRTTESVPADSRSRLPRPPGSAVHFGRVHKFVARIAAGRRPGLQSSAGPGLGPR